MACFSIWLQDTLHFLRRCSIEMMRVGAREPSADSHRMCPEAFAAGLELCRSTIAPQALKSAATHRKGTHREAVFGSSWASSVGSVSITHVPATAGRVRACFCRVASFEAACVLCTIAAAISLAGATALSIPNSRLRASVISHIQPHSNAGPRAPALQCSLNALPQHTGWSEKLNTFI